MWSENPALSNFSDSMSPFFETKLQLSCPVSFNPAPRSLMSQGSPSSIVKVLSTTSLVLEDRAWSTAAGSIWQHLTAKQACKASSIMPGDDSDHDPRLWCLWCFNFTKIWCIAPSISWKAWISVNWGLTVNRFNSEVFALGTSVPCVPWQKSWLREAACTKAPRASSFEHT